MTTDGVDHGAPKQTPPAGGASREALTAVVQGHGSRILRAVRQLLQNEEEARDAFQEGMLAAWRSLGSFRGQSSLATWVHRVVVNHALMRLRQRARRPEQSLDELLPEFTDHGHFKNPPVSWDETPEALACRAETRTLVHACIARLPEALRVPVLLRDIEGMEVADMADLLGATANAVRIRLHRGRNALKALIEPHLQLQTS